MKKQTAIELLGGSVSSAAKTLGVSYQAVLKWPDVLPQRITQRVVGAAVLSGSQQAIEMVAPSQQSKAQQITQAA